uniref:Uncharacterized protein n=1 Tax=Ciona savignyi TaxID=51511 RepID=H2Z6T5_CIOSA
MDPSQERESPHVTPRGIDLASMFMRGVDMALFTNSACGEPIPAKYAAPWMYFDGKVFQHKLFLSLQEGANLVQLCNGQVEQVARVERMRQAVLEGISPPPIAASYLPLLAMGPRPQMPNISKIPHHQDMFNAPGMHRRAPSYMGTWQDNPRKPRPGSSGNYGYWNPYSTKYGGRGRGTTMSGP